MFFFRNIDERHRPLVYRGCGEQIRPQVSKMSVKYRFNNRKLASGSV